MKTLYIGGGTPSLLEAKDIEKVLKYFNFQDNHEITLEANPETVTYQKFKEYKSIGINRISLGVQTFNENILELIGRKHKKKDIYYAIENIKKAEFNNISIDLIYGLPLQNMSIFENDINNAVKLNIEHISSYGLKIEENSYFYDHIPENLPTEETQAEMYLKLCQILKQNNFNHYEISNFAKNGYEANHNTSYWKNKQYYGFGLNASSYINNIRYRNIDNFQEYLKNPIKKAEEIHITIQEQMENEIFLALRLKDGISIKEINKKYNINFENKYRHILQKYTNLNLMKQENGAYKLTEEGILLSNNIMSEFID